MKHLPKSWTDELREGGHDEPTKRALDAIKIRIGREIFMIDFTRPFREEA